MPIALVTGAGVRVGRAIALALARAGFDLLLHVNSSVQPAEQVAEEIRGLGRSATVLRANLEDPLGVESLATAVGRATRVLDLLVHNAGLYEQIPFAEISRQAYQRMLAVNLDAPFFLTQALLPALEAAESPLVVHITDVGAERPVVPGYVHYAVSKAGLLMLTRALALELAPRVRVNAVAPGAVAFPTDFDEERRQEELAHVPLGREGTVEDIARTVVFLATQAPYITGQAINVDGGRSSVL
ncbi:SDR family oxidoreductase [Hyalangium versicolor]|uniref:SDR family oxidoreductase n=1 Tax=Hyalangium versicolor TaxID=2861190 RepID=UPI001CCABF23|nr:SDR family oxidoreductase [Hyalangium versicolor]